MKNIARFLAAVIAALTLDLLTKTWAEQALTPHQPIPILGDFLRFTLGYNTGVTFGLFADSGVVPLVITAVIIITLFIWMAWAIYHGDITGTAVWLFGIVLGGAMGNIIDRLPDLRVTDFIDIGIGTTRWYTFNLADTFIVFGVIFLILITLLEKESPAKQRAGSKKGK